ncbi:MAG: hypothetical protein GF330_00485 [Candidatus Eisenbacteria bacterium]|nr:hypothetical protein [Candidatus Eisenbacteria bacterium]
MDSETAGGMAMPQSGEATILHEPAASGMQSARMVGPRGCRGTRWGGASRAMRRDRKNHDSKAGLHNSSYATLFSGVRQRCFPILPRLIPALLPAMAALLPALVPISSANPPNGMPAMPGMPPGAAQGAATQPSQFDVEAYLERAWQRQLSTGELTSRRTLLENGIEVLLLPDPASRLVTSIAVVRGGSALETPRVSGASHYLEHMLFNGTHRRTQKQLYDEVDAYAAFNNAFTRRTHAAFMLTLPRAYLGRGLDIQSDMLLHSILPPEKFAKERGIILEEMAKDVATERYQLERLLQAETYPASSYGLPVLGTPASLAEMTRKDVWDFYRRYYVPQRMRLVLLGGFDAAAAIDSLNATFGAVPVGSTPYIEPPAPPPLRGDRIVRHRLPIGRSRLRLVWNGPLPGEPEHLATEALVDLLMGSDASPVAQTLTERFPGEVLRWNGGLASGYGFSRVILDVDLATEADLSVVREVLLGALARAEVPTGKALDGWRVARLAAERSARQRSFMYAPLVTEEIALGGTAALQTRLERTAALEVGALEAALAELQIGPSWSILVQANDMSEEALQDALHAAHEDESALPYSISTYGLEPGGQLLRIPAQSNGLISIYLLIEGRNYLEPRGREGITELLHQLLALGPASMRETEFTEALRGIGGQLQTADRGFLPFDDYYTEPGFSFIRFQALEEYAPEALALLARLLREPRWDGEALERLRGAAMARVRREEQSAARRAREALREAVFGADHPASQSPYGSSASLAAIGMNDLRAHYARLFDPRRIWIAVVSDLPATQLRSWAEALVRGWPASSPTLGMTAERFAQWERRESADPQLAERWRAQQGRRDLAAAGERAHVLEAAVLAAAPDGGTAADAQEALAARIAGEILSGRVAFRLREEEGRAYGIGAAVREMAGHLVYVAGAGTRPENAEAMARGFQDVRRAAAARFDPEEADRAAHTLYGSFLRRQESRLNQAMYAVWSARRDRSPLDWWTRSGRLVEIDPAAVARKLSEIAAAPSLILVAR